LAIKKPLVINEGRIEVLQDGDGIDAYSIGGKVTAINPSADSIPISDSEGTLNDWIAQGSGSGLDADTVKGYTVTSYAVANAILALNNDSKLPADITGDASSVGGKVPTSIPTANAIPVADDNGTLNGWVNKSVDGGSASSVYTATQLIDGGNA
jgi:hypothetical protein